MKELIKDIVATDKACRLEVDRAAQRRDMLNAELDEQMRSFEEKCREEAKTKIEMARQQLEKGLNDNEERIRHETRVKSDALKAEFEKNHSGWEKLIVSRIIG